MPSPPSAAAKLATVVGSRSSDDAKIGGMTPRRIQLQRQERGLAVIHAVPNLPLGIVDQQAPLRALHKDHEIDDPHRHRDHEDDEGRGDRTLTTEFEQPDCRGRQLRHDSGEDDDERCPTPCTESRRAPCNLFTEPQTGNMVPPVSG